MKTILFIAIITALTFTQALSLLSSLTTARTATHLACDKCRK